MLNQVQYLIAYPNLAGFSNTYTRTSSKGKKHLVKKGRRKKLLIGAAALGTLGAIAYLAATRGKGKIKAGGTLTRQAQENLDRSNELKKSFDDIAKSQKEQKQQLKEIRKEIIGLVDKVKKQNPNLADEKAFEEFMKSGKTLRI